VSRGTWRALLPGAVVVHLAVLYWPDPPDTGVAVPGLDLLVHVVVFGAVAVCAVRAGVRPAVVVGVLLAHAVVSELLQAYAVPERTGDWRDALADAVGTLVGVLVARTGRPAAAARRADARS
jgi:VanZ family protein